MTARKGKPRKGNGRATDDALVEQVAGEVQEWGEMFFWRHPAHLAEDRKSLAKSNGAWARCITKLLVFIRSSAISDSQKEALISSLFEALLLSDQATTVERDAIDRYKGEIAKLGTAKARARKQAHNRQLCEIVRHYAERRWKENPARRPSASGTAADILHRVNAELAGRGRGKISVRTLRQHISKLA
jgi:hypothetical protein